MFVAQTCNNISDVKPSQIRDDLNEDSPDERSNGSGELGISALLEERKLKDISVVKVEIDPETEAQVTSGQDEEHVAFVETS